MNHNYSNSTRTPLITVDNDAKSCFNCILCNVAMLLSQYFGIAQNMCSLHAATLENNLFKINTTLGKSVRTYQNSKRVQYMALARAVEQAPPYGCSSALSSWIYYKNMPMECKWWT
jgi:hypothetical protein